MTLTPQQRQELKGRAHALKPTVMIGQNGLTENVLAEIDNTLEAHELIKIKIAGSEKEEREQIAQMICQSTQSELVQMIGRIVIIFRKKKKKK